MLETKFEAFGMFEKNLKKTREKCSKYSRKVHFLAFKLAELCKLSLKSSVNRQSINVNSLDEIFPVDLVSHFGELVL